MSGIHRINLSTAWQPPAAGGAAWVRRFGRPDGLEPSTRVWLVHDGGQGTELILNGAPLPAGDRHDVTTILGKRNELLLVPASERPAGGTVGAGGDHSATNRTAVAGQSAHGRRPLDPYLGRLHLEIMPDHP
jgi:hypothetical protein